MAPRLPSLLRPPLGFVRVGSGPAGVERFGPYAAPLVAGAPGLAATVWRTAEGVAVLDPTGSVGGRLRRRPIAACATAELADRVVSLVELFAELGTTFPLLLSVGDAEAVPEVVAVARDAGAEERVWIAHADHALLASWRPLSPAVKLVESTRLAAMRGGPERHAADVARAGVDAVDLHHGEWSGGLVALFHRFERMAVGRDAQFERNLDALLDAGIDAVICEHADRLVPVLARHS